MLRTGVLLVVVVALAAMGCGKSSKGARAAAGPAGKVTALAGEVTATRAAGEARGLKLGDEVFADDVIKTGKPVLSGERLQNQRSFYASPAAAAGRVYFVDRDGTTAVLKQGDKLEVLATNRLDDPIDASPVLVGKQLFLRGEKFLYCIEEK